MTNIQELCSKAKRASYELGSKSSQQKTEMLNCIGQEILLNAKTILSANKLDLDNAADLSIAMQDRLRLDEKRIEAIAEGVFQVAKLDDPIGEKTEEWTNEKGLRFSKIRVPLGVIGVIFEARPNVTADVASLCLMSGNCVVLRGGKEAVNSNRAIYQVIKNALEKNGFNSNFVAFVDDTSRDGTMEMLQQSKYIDVIIPRGGNGLKEFVLANAKMPVIASAGGNCHTFVDESADLDMAVEVICNAKMSRPSTCNALEQLLVHENIAEKFLPKLVQKLIPLGCKLNGCQKAHSISNAIELADESEYTREHLDYILTIFVVKDCQEAVARTNENSTHHSEAILSKSQDNIDYFVANVDSGCVYINTSTRFTDGFEFGFGAEIGISTQKLHARGPLGLKQLTSEKYVITGNGQVRK